MAVNTSQRYGCENVAFVTSDDVSLSHQLQRWHGLNDGLEWSRLLSPSLPDRPLLEQTERPMGFEDHFHSLPTGDVIRGASIPVAQLRNEVSWPWEQLDGSKQSQTDLPTLCDIAGTKESTLKAVINTEPVKRKRGRPRLEAPYLKQQESVASAKHNLADRISQLEKNRIAANKCRRHRKEYTSKLVAQHASMSARNQALKADVTVLREQMLNLKNEVLQHAKCGSWVIDSYVTRIAGEISNGDVLIARASESSNSVETPHSTISTNDTGETGSDDTLESHSRENSADFGISLGDQKGLWFLDYDRVMEVQQDT